MRTPVKKGDKITAQSWNSILSYLDAVDESKFNSSGGGALATRHYSERITIKNNTGVNLLTGQVLKITGVRSATNTKAAFQSSGIQLSGSTPSGSENETVAILTEAIPAGKIGRCIVPGIFAAYVLHAQKDSSSWSDPNVPEYEQNGNFAKTASGNSCYLETASDGNYKILAASNVDSTSPPVRFCFLVPNGGSGGGGGHYVGRTTGSAVQNATRTATIPVDFNDTSAEIRFPLTRPGAMLQAFYTVIVSKNLETGEFEIISVECPVGEEDDSGSGSSSGSGSGSGG